MVYLQVRANRKHIDRSRENMLVNPVPLVARDRMLAAGGPLRSLPSTGSHVVLVAALS
jgi:hypothetical protein